MSCTDHAGRGTRKRDVDGHGPTRRYLHARSAPELERSAHGLGGASHVRERQRGHTQQVVCRGECTFADTHESKHVSVLTRLGGEGAGVGRQRTAGKAVVVKHLKHNFLVFVRDRAVAHHRRRADDRVVPRRTPAIVLRES